MFFIVLSLLLVVAGTVESAKGACGEPLQPNSNTTIENDFLVQQLLLAGFRAKGVNSYGIRRGGFTAGGGNKRQCIAVTYNITCGENTTEICDNTNCNEELDFDEEPFFVMWTTFNGSSATGNNLLKLSAIDLRVFGFEFCDVYIDPIDIAITLESQEEMLSICYNLRASLVEFTTLLPSLSDADDSDNIPVPIGYAIPWCNASQLVGEYDQNTMLVSILLLITSKLIIITFCYELFHHLWKNSIRRKTHKWYHVYWATQILILIGMFLLIDFARRNQKNKVALQLFHVSLIVDGVVTFISLVGLLVLAFIRRLCRSSPYSYHEEEIVLSMQASVEHTSVERVVQSGNGSHQLINSCPAGVSLEQVSREGQRQRNRWYKITTDGKIFLLDEENYLVPPPLSPLCCSLCHNLFQYCYRNVLKRNDRGIDQEESAPLQQTSGGSRSFAKWNKDGCMILWTLFTNATSFFVFLALFSYLTQAIPAIAISYYLNPIASLIRLGFFEIAAIIFLMEIAYIIYLIEKFIWLCHIHYTKQIPEEILDEDKECRYIDMYLNKASKEGSELVSIIDGKWRCRCISKLGKCFHWLLLTTLFQIITFGFVIYLSWRLLHFVLIIIIDQTADPNDQFKDILAILPTIALNVWLLLKQGNITHALKDMVSKANKTTMEHGNEHHTFIHYGSTH